MLRNLRSKRAVEVDNQTRQTLQEVQYSSDGKSFVPSPVMTRRGVKAKKDPVRNSFKIHADDIEKENKSSKRNVKEKSTKVPALKVTNPKSKKSKSKKIVDSQESAAVQTKLDSFVTLEPSSQVSSDPALQNVSNSVQVFKSFSDESDMLTADVPPESYWKLLAEKRRQILERALMENEQMKEQLDVLEAENQQLHSLLKECESVLEIIAVEGDN